MYSIWEKQSAFRSVIRKDSLGRQFAYMRDKAAIADRYMNAFEKLDCPQRLAEEYQELL
jgi:hypothetical protein